MPVCMPQRFRSGVEWILVKGICDFADGFKDLHKSTNQQVASANAVDLCRRVFETPGALQLRSDEAKKESSPTLSMALAAALFDRYQISSEPYYLVRNWTSRFQTRYRSVTFGSGATPDEARQRR